ncbi:MAG: hypothetical protein U0165_17275, partial [Polyangiaceae bacterium]
RGLLNGTLSGAFDLTFSSRALVRAGVTAVAPIVRNQYVGFDVTGARFDVYRAPSLGARAEVALVYLFN